MQRILYKNTFQFANVADYLFMIQFEYLLTLHLILRTRLIENHSPSNELFNYLSNSKSHLQSNESNIFALFKCPIIKT